jgi:SPOR domain
MADSSSYRSSRGGALTPRRDEASSDPARQAVSDPLAELARLIGQDEAFGAIVRNSARPEPRPESREPEPREPDPPPSSWRGRSELAGWQTRQAQPEVHDAHAYGDDGQAHAATAYDPHHYDHAVEEDQAAAHYAPAAAGQYGHDAGGEYYGEGGEGHEGQEGHYEGEEEYADPVPERRRGAIVMVAAVAGLALVGTAGAFGYWAWSTGPRGEPPLIKADTNPNKVVPATQGEGAGNKSVYDRYADKGGTSERMVSREEAPADIKPAPPRSVYPSAGGVYGPAPAQSAVVAPPASGVSVNGEPRKVHTEVIRPNQMAAADIGQPVAPPLAVAATPPSPPPAPAAPAKQPAPRAKQAAQTPATQPTDTPPAREAASTGGFVVQLSSQKTEEEARASFKVLAQKYAAVFGDREPYIKRVTIPDKGTFYRANVGPFATQSEANHFCSNLKIVGGQCIVQKN